jgi:two-component system cell cycle sensor histidine kinase PleC
VNIDINTYILLAMAMFFAALAVMVILLRNSMFNERKLARRLNEAIETCNKRGEFFSNMTHELRTPLSIILGAVQLIEKDSGELPRSERTAKNLNTIKFNCYRLLRLTNNLLDLARSESGYLALKPVNCELNALIDEIVQSVRPFADKKELELRCVKTEKPIKIALDIEKTERIMLNLLSNAIKFSSPGGTVTVSISESGSRAYISVKDTGVGIPADMQQEIFVRYKQSGQCHMVENEGSGIGLSLVKTFVELHNGNIQLISEIGMGSEFIIDLPLITTDDSSESKKFSDFSYGADEAAKVEFSGTHSITT